MKVGIVGADAAGAACMFALAIRLVLPFERHRRFAARASTHQLTIREFRGIPSSEPSRHAQKNRIWSANAQRRSQASHGAQLSTVSLRTRRQPQREISWFHCIRMTGLMVTPFSLSSAA